MFTSENLGINGKGHLTIGGCDAAELAEKYGTPLYLMDEDCIRLNCRAYRDAMRRHFGYGSTVAFASKAFCISYMYRLLAEEEMSADIVSGGELYTAVNAGFPADRLFFHGNNKTADEIDFALSAGVGHFIVDNYDELYLLNSLAKSHGQIAKIMFRLKPGIDAHTHEFIKTGKIDSKFGVAIENGEAFEIVREALKLDNVELTGIHCHIGSQIFETEPYALAAQRFIEFIAKVRDNLGYEIREMNLGGGFGIKYTESNDPHSPEENVAAIAEAVELAAEKYSLTELPRMIIEPGRCIVGPAGITLYTVGSVKEIPGIRTYVSIDGGMTDNPRYALYDAEYEALDPCRPLEKRTMKITLAGRNCESGDIIGKDMMVQPLKTGDLVCVLATGAYNYSMSSNYNRVPRPPVVMVSEGTDRLAVKRETYRDIIANDIL